MGLPLMSENLIKQMLVAIGEDPSREGLRDTPARVVRSWRELYGGYSQDPAAILAASFTETSDYDQLLLLGPIEFYSTCEHHLLPFFGTAIIGYLPSLSGRVVGVSKLARVVEAYARRLQIQERMTQQIAKAVITATEARGVGVIMRAQHMCMTSRGVQKQSALMTTSALLGLFRDNPATREEFMRLAIATMEVT